MEFWDYIRSTAIAATPVLITVLGVLARRQMSVIHVLVNTRLDKALARIEDLEKVIKERTQDTGSTAQSLRTHERDK